jgi:(1->4)-alpha-D-glucan 1-alpha-D-glucosylmutase
MKTPRATMRLQFHKGFTFDAAVRIVPYLAALHVSHLYASPILTARSGSMHGYDVIDPTQVNPELGGEPGFRRLAACRTWRIIWRTGYDGAIDSPAGWA